MDSANKNGSLLEVVQALIDLNLTVSRAYITSDGDWFMDGNPLYSLLSCSSKYSTFLFLVIFIIVFSFLFCLIVIYALKMTPLFLDFINYMVSYDL